MKKFLSPLALFLLTGSLGLAQSVFQSNWPIVVLRHPTSWIRTSSLAAGHLGSVESQIANIGSTNPANIVSSYLEGFGLTAGGVSPSELLQVKFQRSPILGLRNFGVIKALGSMELGFAYSQPYSLKMTTNMLETTVTQPAVSDVATVTNKATLMTNSIVLGWSHRLSQSRSGLISFGIRFGQARLDYFNGINTATLANVSQNSACLAYGVKLKLARGFEAGLFVESRLRLNTTFQYEIDSTLNTDSLNTVIYGPWLEPGPVNIQAELPTVIQGGVQYRFDSGWKMGGEARYGLWSRLDGDYRDSWDVNLNFAPPKFGSISPRFGINWVPYVYEIDPVPGIDYSTLFEYLAIDWEKTRYSIELFVADSHLFGGKNWQETAVRLSLNYRFGSVH